MDITTDSKSSTAATATATTGTTQTGGHILLDWKMSTDEKTRECPTALIKRNPREQKADRLSFVVADSGI
jgi:hypothetical protein